MLSQCYRFYHELFSFITIDVEARDLFGTEVTGDL